MISDPTKIHKYLRKWADHHKGGRVLIVPPCEGVQMAISHPRIRRGGMPSRYDTDITFRCGKNKVKGDRLQGVSGATTWGTSGWPTLKEVRSMLAFVSKCERE